MGRKILFALLTVAIVVVGALVISRWRDMAEIEPGAEVQIVSEESLSITLFFAGRDADGMKTEAREIAVGEGFEQQVRDVVEALIQGPESDDMVSAIPAGVEVLVVFWVEETQTIFIDFNRALVANHSGGSTGEYYTIGMILRTVSSNFPQVRKLQFLVDGYPVETIAGHYATGKPLDVQKWR